MHLYHLKSLIVAIGLYALVACDANNQQVELTEQQKQIAQQEQAEVLPFLNIQEINANLNVPSCGNKKCIELDIQTITTQDPWLNEWIAGRQSKVISDQIRSEKSKSLQEAVNAYAKASQKWQKEFIKNKAYELQMDTKIALQRNQYVLLQVIVNTEQAGIKVKDRGYFYVADRKLKKNLSVLDVVEPKKKRLLNEIVNTQYTQWLSDQKLDPKKIMPKKISWEQHDWFFDNEGIGIHFRAGEIAKDASQLDIFLSKAQTQQVLRPKIFERMF